MSGGLVQLVAYGIEDIILIKDPQITFFKLVYRRHTNFATEMIVQKFDTTPDFGKKVSCTLSRNGDLLNRMYLVAKLPRIPKFFKSDGSEDTVAKFMWVRKVGFALIKDIEITIGGQVIDKQYGDYLNIWFELVGRKDNSFDHMIGNIKEVKEWSNGKPSYTLYIPLQFWFCRSSGLALPLVSLHFSEVRVNLTLNEADYCSLVAPTHYIQLHDDLVGFEQFEYFSQGSTEGIFIDYDPIEKKMYYNKLNSGTVTAPTQDNLDLTDDEVDTNEKIEAIMSSSTVDTYRITGRWTEYIATPGFGAVEKRRRTNKPDLNLDQCYLLCDYVYLDSDERKRFLQNEHEYLIETVQYDGEIDVMSNYYQASVAAEHPCKEMFWVAQLNNTKKSWNNDHFNYTDALWRNKDDSLPGNGLVQFTEIMMNEVDRVSGRYSGYFDQIQPYFHHSYEPEKGINCYNYGLFPEKVQPSGTMNMTKVNRCKFGIRLNNNIAFSNSAGIRIYTLGYNIIRVIHGLAGIVFTTPAKGTVSL